MKSKGENSTTDKLSKGKDRDKIIEQKINIILEKVKKNLPEEWKGYLIFGLDMATNDKHIGLCIMACDEKLMKLELVVATTWEDFSIRKIKLNLKKIIIEIIKKILDLRSAKKIFKLFWVVDIPFGWPEGFAEAVNKILASETISDKNSGQFFERRCEWSLKKNSNHRRCLNVAADKIAVPAFKFAAQFRGKLQGICNGELKTVFGFNNEKEEPTKNSNLLMETYPAAFITHLKDDGFIGYNLRRYYKYKNKNASAMIRLAIFATLCKKYSVGAFGFDEIHYKSVRKFFDNTDRFLSKNKLKTEEFKIEKLEQFINEFNSVQNDKTVKVKYESKSHVKPKLVFYSKPEAQFIWDKIINNDHVFDGFLCALSGFDYLRWALGGDIKLFRPEIYLDTIQCSHACFQRNYCAEKIIKKEGWFVFRMESQESQTETNIE